MFTRKDALDLLAATFPVETIRQQDLSGKIRNVVWTAEKRLEHHYIDLCEPSYDGLKEGAEGLDERGEKNFRTSVEHDYKNKHGLWP